MNDTNLQNPQAPINPIESQTGLNSTVPKIVTEEVKNPTPPQTIGVTESDTPTPIVSASNPDSKEPHKKT